MSERIQYKVNWYEHIWHMEPVYYALQTQRNLRYWQTKKILGTLSLVQNRLPVVYLEDDDNDELYEQGHVRNPPQQ
jgi:hypothetical protein